MSRLRQKIGIGAVVASAVSTAFVTVGTPAQIVGADPLISRAFVGVGSDTTQDVFNAFAGFSNGRPFTPLISNDGRPTASWDAMANPNTNCITPKLGFGAIDRPFGSGDGQKTISRAATNTRWDKGLGCSLSTISSNVAGAIDFARSSSGPPAAFPGTTLTFIPFARDGLGYAFVDKNSNGTFAAGLTTDELRAGYGTGNVPSATGTFVKNGETVRVCGVNPASGTVKSWDKSMGNSGNGVTVNASGANSGCGTAYEEHDGNEWFASAFITGLAANENAIIPFSGAQWVSQGNGVSVDRTGAARAGGVDMGEIILSATGVSIGKPYVGTPPSYSPNTTFNANTTFGRDMYVVVPTAKVPAIGGDSSLKSLFRGATSAICSTNGVSISNQFGFSSPPSVACGTTGVASLQSGYVS